MRGPRCGYCRGQGLSRGDEEVTLEASQFTTRSEHRGLGVEQEEDSVCQVLKL